jgi:hypothetical protein
MAPLQMSTWTYRVIGIFGLVLSAVGLAGMTAYSVAQRARENGATSRFPVFRAELGLAPKKHQNYPRRRIKSWRPVIHCSETGGQNGNPGMVFWAPYSRHPREASPTVSAWADCKI